MHRFLRRLFYSILSGYNEADFWAEKERCRNTKNKFLKFLFLRRYNKLSLKFGAYVGYNASFSEPPILPHSLFGIFISDSATIGKSCVIFHHVTIGSNTLKDSTKFGAPTIGHNCYIGAGAKIIGNIHIGDNVRIGANCVVTQDIPSNSTVVLPQPRIIVKENVDNSFIRQKRDT